MTRFTLSAPQRPMFQSAPYRQSPARREHIYGRVRSDLDDQPFPWLWLCAAIVSPFIAALISWMGK